MTFDLTCQTCDASFDVELSDLLEEPVLECPSCEARAPRAAVEGMTSALDDLFTQLALLNRKFTVSMEVESDDLPVAYDREPPRRAAAEDDDEEEEKEKDGEAWDEEGAEEEPADEDDDR